jgi:type IV secretion system protein VirB10
VNANSAPEQGAEMGDVAAVATGTMPGEPGPGLAGERRAAWVARGVSMQAKVQNALALALVVLLGGAFLYWYYARVAAAPAPAAEQTRAKAAAAGEMRLPPFGRAPPRPAPAVEATRLVDPDSTEGQALLASGEDAGGPALAQGPPVAVQTSGPTPGGYATPPPPDPVQQRRLEAPVLIRGTGSYAVVSVADPHVEIGADGRSGYSGPPWPSPVGPAVGGSEFVPANSVDGSRRPESGSASGSGSSSALAGMLQPSRTAAVAAVVGPERRYLLPRGAFIDCTLETAIDSSLPGLTTCITATDVWSADGTVVLLERGTKLVGETRGEVRPGQQRLFVLWSEARTPSGVIVELASPGTDSLGRSGVTGEVDTRFAARFGAAILISLIDAGVAALVASQNSGDGNVVIAPQGASDVVAEVLRQTGNVPPTIRVAQGERLQVLVARDVSFAGVYALVAR